MRLTPPRTLAAGAALVVLANAVALSGVYWNRSGEPEARLTLSQRELGTPWGWGLARENSGLELSLDWRVHDGSVAEYFYGGHGFHGGTPEWLDEARMRALGFEAGAVNEDAAARRRFERQLPREVLLVLELAGPAWQRALELARENARRHEAARLANADSKEFAEKARRAAEQLQREERTHSRLFAVDVGLDRAALRAKYPDRARYLVLKAKLRPRLETRERKLRATGHVSELAVTRINVPHAFRASLEPALRKPGGNPADRSAAFEATLAVGQRLEPWIEAISLR